MPTSLNEIQLRPQSLANFENAHPAPAAIFKIKSSATITTTNKTKIWWDRTKLHITKGKTSLSAIF